MDIFHYFLEYDTDLKWGSLQPIKTLCKAEPSLHLAGTTEIEKVTCEKCKIFLQNEKGS